MLTSGLFDLQVNGYGGVDFNADTITPAEIDRALEAMLATGVTLCLPTLITARPHELEARLKALDAAISASTLGPAMCPGYHLEGPFLNPAPGYCGCHPAEAMTAADPALIARLREGLDRPVLMVTLAPEISGGLELARELAASGIVVALGHTAADFDQVAAAADAGATVSTHLGNGMPQQAHKLNNSIIAQLGEDRLWASFIADGIHLHRQALKVLLRAKGFERSILVTDAVVGAAAVPGRYSFGGMPVERGTDGSVRLAGTNSLAGSALCLDEAVRNVVAWELASFDEAIAMAAKHPLAAMATAFAAAGLQPAAGEVEWDDALNVRRVRLGSIQREFPPG